MTSTGVDTLVINDSRRRHRISGGSGGRGKFQFGQWYVDLGRLSCPTNVYFPGWGQDFLTREPRRSYRPTF